MPEHTPSRKLVSTSGSRSSEEQSSLCASCIAVLGTVSGSRIARFERLSARIEVRLEHRVSITLDWLATELAM